jgi:uncharacterized protein (TIGR02757 family)
MDARLKALKPLLDESAARYNQPGFIPRDPVSIPHRFQQPADIEIAGFFAAILAWGQRTTIINSCNRLLAWMDHAPHQFITQHADTDLKPMLGFAHRTFNATDLLYFISFLQYHYSRHSSLEQAFVPEGAYTHDTVEQALVHVHNYFFSLEHPVRTHKHIATPARKSACKRLNMFLRWMVRRDNGGVDFGLWHSISPAQLVCPLDVHVARVAHRLGLLESETSNWANALQLTGQLRQMRPEDPVVYDFALFGLGIDRAY